MEKIEKAVEQFSLLKQNLENFTLIQLLSLSGKIKNNIVSDEELNTACLADVQVAEQRRALLEEIKEFQIGQIQPILSNNSSSNTQLDASVQVLDFEEAKDNLKNICKEELRKDYFSNQYDILSDISELTAHKKTLESVVEHCTDSRYRVLLMAEFQSGKTTLMNALCGRLIGQMGKGIATSAVPIEVSYGEKDEAFFKWKSQNELESLFEHINAIWDDSIDIRVFSLDDENLRIQLLNKIDAYRHTEEFSVCDEREVKYLAICSFILRYFDSSELKKFKTETINIYDVVNFTSFPNAKDGLLGTEEFVTRWKKRGYSDFSFREAVFCFIDHVEVTCVSDKLKEINCTIVDCPGLSSSAYDTSITTSEIAKADAILYLTQYNKAIGEKDNEILYRIRNGYKDCWRKLIVLNNYTPTTDFNETNRAIIKDLFGEQTLFIPIDVYVASLGSFKYSYDTGCLSQYEIKSFLKAHGLKPSRFQKTQQVLTDFNSCWESELKRLFGNNIILDNNIVMEELTEVYQNMSAFVENNSAYSIIYSNGIYKLFEELSTIEGRLRTTPESFVDGREKTRTKLERQLVTAKEFNQSLPELAYHFIFDNRSNKESLVYRLSDVVYSDIFSDDTYKSIFHDICDIIYENKFKIVKLAVSEKKLNEFLKPKIKDSIYNVIRDKVTGWNHLMLTNEARSFGNIFTPEMQNFQNILNDKWKEKYKDDERMANKFGIYFKLPSTTKELAITAFSADENVTPDIKLIIGSIMLNLSVFISGISMLISSYVCFLILSVYAGAGVSFTNPVTAAIGMIAGLVGGIAVFACEDKIRDHFIEKMSAKIEAEFAKNGVYSKFRESILSVVSSMMKSFTKKTSIDLNHLESDMTRILNSSDEQFEWDCYESISIIDSIHQQERKYIDFIVNNTQNK